MATKKPKQLGAIFINLKKINALHLRNEMLPAQADASVKVANQGICILGGGKNAKEKML